MLLKTEVIHQIDSFRMEPVKQLKMLLFLLTETERFKELLLEQLLVDIL